MFRGVQHINMDAKGRLAMPARQREPLLSRCDGQIVVTIDTQTPCLAVYPLPEWERIERDIQALPALKPAVKRFQRLESRWPQGISGPRLRKFTGEQMLPHKTHPPEEDTRRNIVCRFSHEYSTADGCLHRCLYCAAGAGVGRTVTLMLNIEEFIRRAVIPCHEAHPWQKAYRACLESTWKARSWPRPGAAFTMPRIFARWTRTALNGSPAWESEKHC